MESFFLLLELPSHWIQYSADTNGLNLNRIVLSNTNEIHTTIHALRLWLRLRLIYTILIRIWCDLNKTRNRKGSCRMSIFFHSTQSLSLSLPNKSVNIPTIDWTAQCLHISFHCLMFDVRCGCANELLEGPFQIGRTQIEWNWFYLCVKTYESRLIHVNDRNQRNLHLKMTFSSCLPIPSTRSA